MKFFKFPGPVLLEAVGGVVVIVLQWWTMDGALGWMVELLFFGWWLGGVVVLQHVQLLWMIYVFFRSRCVQHVQGCAQHGGSSAQHGHGSPVWLLVAVWWIFLQYVWWTSCVGLHASSIVGKVSFQKKICKKKKISGENRKERLPPSEAKNRYRFFLVPSRFCF
uniref:L-serine-phosphatidylethanolamine phosphatidyltransferase n=1 Tax=Meloidogyne hapla TaxID=6305 RepID=A0A1I8B3R7_MELHA